MSTANHWLQAFRLRTLPLALSSIAMGGFLARAADAFRWDIFLLCIVTTVFLQVLSNLANDYGDSIHGADSIHRTGPPRAVQAGLIPAARMRTAVVFFALLSLGSGIALLFVSFGWDWKALLFFLMLGLLSIAAAITYTVGRKPYGYLGLGDLAVVIFFGFVGVLGSYYLYTRELPWPTLLPALSMGLFAVAVLNVNNIRDIEADRRAGKYSVPVRLGRTLAVRYHWALLSLGVACGVLYTITHFRSPWQFLFLLAVPLFIRNGVAIAHKPSALLDPYLKQMAAATLLFVLLFGTGLLMAS